MVCFQFYESYAEGTYPNPNLDNSAGLTITLRKPFD